MREAANESIYRSRPQRNVPEATSNHSMNVRLTAAGREWNSLSIYWCLSSFENTKKKLALEAVVFLASSRE